MALLKIIKLSTKTWKHNSDVDGDFILTKFYAKQEDNEFLLVETYGAKRRKYLISEIEVYDIGGTAETFSNFTDLFLRLEALKYPAFYVDGESTGGGTWGTITGNLSDQTDLETALNLKQNTLDAVNFGEFMDLELATKLTPSPNDTILGRDFLTNEAVEFNYPIVEGYFNGTNFYLESGFINLITATTGRTYVNLSTNLQYRWSGSAYVQIGGGGSAESDLHSYWFSYTASYQNNVILYTNTPTTVLTSNGTLTLVGRIGTTLYNSYHFFNFLSATTAGSNAGTKMNNSAEGHYRQGIEAYFIFGNNDTNTNHVTAVGSYGLLSNIPNLNIANFTTDFVGVGNDPTDTNLSFYCKRIDATASYLKIPTNSNFPAHTVGADIYMLKFESNKVLNQLDFQIKLTLTNLINGAEISHTFTGLECPDLNKAFINCVNRSNRNTGVAASIRWIKTYVKQLIF